MGLGSLRRIGGGGRNGIRKLASYVIGGREREEGEKGKRVEMNEWFSKVGRGRTCVESHQLSILVMQAPSGFSSGKEGEKTSMRMVTEP